MAKKNRNKFFNLLNKDGSLNSFLKKMRFKTNNNNFISFVPKVNKILKSPKNTVEMNKLLIISFALNKGASNEFSKHLNSINEIFFFCERNENGKGQIELETMDKNGLNCTNSISIESIGKREKEWKKNFLLSIYKNKLSEKEFKNFK